jgi:hypothetical protein
MCKKLKENSLLRKLCEKLLMKDIILSEEEILSTYTFKKIRMLYNYKNYIAI